MPLFEFICSKCGHKFEELVSNSNERGICPKCHCQETEKQFSSFSAISSTQSSPSCPASPFCPSAQGGHKCGCGCRH